MASAGSSSVDASEAHAERADVAAPVSAPRVAEVLEGAAAIGTANTCPAGIRNQHVLLTYAQCEAPLEFVIRVVCHSRFVLGCAAVVETHRDGGHHVHVYLQKKRGELSWENVIFTWQGKSHRPHVRSLTTALHKRNAWEYLHKEGEVQIEKDFREPPPPRPRSGSVASSQDLLEVAAASSIDSALAQYIREGGDLSRVGPVQRGLQVLLAGPERGPRWDPGFPEIQLLPWQTLLLSYLNERPERRRLFWVCGEPNSGKTTFSNWLENPDNYDGGILNLGACDNVVNALHNYRTEAVVCLDYPMSFDWARKSEAVSTVCECFSEFGSNRQSTKYMGRRITICCHLVVFSNRMPIIEVRHRNVVLIETDTGSEATTIVMEPRTERGSSGARSRSRSPLR